MFSARQAIDQGSFEETRLLFLSFRLPGGCCGMLCAAVMAWIAAMCGARPCFADESILPTVRFGPVHLVKSEGGEFVAILFSDFNGWTRADSEWASVLTKSGGSVIGIDSKVYRQHVLADGEDCFYLGGEVKRLSQIAEKELHQELYEKPVIVGRGEGAALAYALVAQSPDETFLGGIGVEFCPELHLPKNPCWPEEAREQPIRKGGRDLLPPYSTMLTPFWVLNSKSDSRCPKKEAAGFVSRIPNANMLTLAAGGKKSAEAERMRAIATAIHDIKESQPDVPVEELPPGLKNLPLVEVAGAAESPRRLRKAFVVFLSGDGGWSYIDRDIAEELAMRGLPAVGWSTLRYFWTEKSAEETAADIDRVVRAYAKAWKRSELVLAGYSFGSDVLALVVRKLSLETRKRLRLLVLISPSIADKIELRLKEDDGELERVGEPLAPRVAFLDAEHLLCLYGKEEDESLCRALSKKNADVREIPGGHTFDGDASVPAAQIIAKVREVLRHPGGRSPFVNEGRKGKTGMHGKVLVPLSGVRRRAR